MALLQTLLGAQTMLYLNGDRTRSAEEHISYYYSPGWWTRFVCRLGFTMPIDKFKPEGAANFMVFYWIWCRRHQKYKASYLHGHDQVAVCGECEQERRNMLSKPGSF